MATRVMLTDHADGNNQWAIIKDINELNAGDRRATRGAVPVTLGENERKPTVQYRGDYDDVMKNALLARIITEWNLGKPEPKGDPSVLDELSIEQIDKLYAAVGGHVDFLQGGIPDPSEKDSDPTSA